MQKFKTLIFEALVTYALLAAGHGLYRLGAEAVNHFRKHPTTS